VPEFGGETSSVTEAKEAAPPTQKTEEPAAMPKAPLTKLIETRVDEGKDERSKTEEAAKMPEILCPSAEATVLKAKKSPAITPRRKRMVNVLDILETTDSKCPSSIKKVAESVEA
jgi:predicted P-loop ATPase